jgi:hypothetical protein
MANTLTSICHLVLPLLVLAIAYLLNMANKKHDNENNDLFEYIIKFFFLD